MSIQTMTAVWRGSQHSGSALLMMLAIADFADNDGVAYPSVSTLAERTRMKPRNANYLLITLQESGELVVKVGAGPRGTNLYRIALDRLQGMQTAAVVQPNAGVQRAAEVQGVAGVQPGAQGGATGCAEPLQPIAPEPSLNHQEPSKRKARTGITLTCPDGVDSQTWSDWLDLRKAKKAPVTQTVLKAAIAESAKAGITLDAFLAIWCLRGTQGLMADWLKPQELQRSQAQTFRERDADNAAARVDEMTGGLVSAKPSTPITRRNDALQEVFDVAPRLVG